MSTDEGDGDGWPPLREKVLAADVLVLATPIWMGQPSSVCKVLLDRLDAESSESDDQDLHPRPKKVRQATADTARHLAHLTRVLTENPYPPA